MSRKLAFLVVVVALCFGPLSGPALGASAKVYTPGSVGLGDPYFPLDGNGGYDVRHYLLDVSYDPATDVLTGVATIRARATQNLSSFNLDFVGLTVRSIKVNGRNASWSRTEGELTVTPRSGLPKGKTFEVVVRYRGVPETINDLFGASGFIHTDDGALVIGEPHVAATWFPANDHPRDKASFTFRITVPRDLEAIANGVLKSNVRHGSRRTWTWDAKEPMATYLAGMGIGQFDIRSYRKNGIRYWDAIDSTLMADQAPPITAAA
ncbi:MAG: M1 family peptidase, partial [Candidatus Limnocylindrales bacterium]